MVKSSEGQQFDTNREGQSPKQSGALEKEGGGKVGYETENGELHAPNTLKHTREGTPEIKHVKHGVRKVVHVDDLPRSEARKGKEESQQKSC